MLRLRHRILALTAAVCAGVVVLAAAAPAQAVFPGRNGRIVWVKLSPAGWGELFDMRPYGSGRRRLTHDPAPDFRPGYSPDGQRIAFAHYPVGDEYPIPRNDSEIFGHGRRLLGHPAGHGQPTD